jgi:hypothetical protein
VFEIGNSLREARLRQSLDFNEVERRTKIRGKYLRALEEERFELLPAQTYIKGFLRTYADVLGLDGQLYVDEYNSRFVVGDDELGLRPRRSAARQQRNRRLESNVVLIALAAIALVTALVIGAWKSGGGDGVKPRFQSAVLPAKKASEVPTTGVLLVITAKRGNSLLEIHAKGANGPLRYQGTLLKGGTPLKVWARKLWINVGTPENLDVTLNGHRVTLGGTGQPRVLLVDRRGVHPASAA